MNRFRSMVLPAFAVATRRTRTTLKDATKLSDFDFIMYKVTGKQPQQFMRSTVFQKIFTPKKTLPAKDILATQDEVMVLGKGCI